MGKHELSPEITAFKAALALKRITQKAFCESRGINIGYFRLQMCGAYYLSATNAAHIRDFMASIRFIDTGATTEASHE
jgi:hypothetical protein